MVSRRFSPWLLRNTPASADKNQLHRRRSELQQKQFRARPQRAFASAGNSKGLVSLFTCLVIATAIAVPGAAIAQTQTNASSGSLQTVYSPQRQTLQEDMEYLAGEELRGRGVGDEGINLAADYLVKRMKDIGLDTEVWQDSPKQPFEVLLGAQASNQETNFIEVKNQSTDQPAKRWSLDDGFGPMAIGASIGKQTGPLVFAGYGITAKNLEYDDYEGIEADGAVVIVLRKEPQRNDPESRFNGIENTRHALFNTKIKNAIDHGAAALILVNDQDSIKAAAEEVQKEKKLEQERLKQINQKIADLPRLNAAKRRQLRASRQRILAAIQALEREELEAKRGVLGMSEAGRRRPDQDTIPIVSVGRDVIDQWINDASGKSLTDLEAQIDETGKPASIAMNDSIASLSVGIEPLNTEAYNVLGFLAGKGELADETVVVGAHYDHVGMGGNGSLAPGTIAVHNGADDNASGTVAMLSTATQISKRLTDSKNYRRVVFIGFSAEERGLLGSKHYVKQPRFPLESTVAMINLDMVGRLLDNELTVYGTGSGEDFEALVDRTNEKQAEPFDIFKMASGYGPSDHQSFNEVGIPVLFFFTGIHNDYHRPSDDFDKINFGGLTRITDIVSDIVFDLATRDARPKFAETNRRVEIRRQMTAFMGIGLQDNDGMVTVSAVTNPGPSATAGIKEGDQISKLANQKVSTSSEVIDWVRKQKPGMQATLEIIRDSKTLEITVELGKREAQ